MTTDFFAFDDSSDYYKLQGLGQACDMGDAMVGDALQGVPDLAWYAIRNASDPQIPNPTKNIEAASKQAAEIYARYGGLTTAASLIATWAVIQRRHRKAERVTGSNSAGCRSRRQKSKAYPQRQEAMSKAAAPTSPHAHEQMPTIQLGRLPRSYDPRVPHMSAAARRTARRPRAGERATTRQGCRPTSGMMLNDTLGDCTCAAFYHAMQVWSFNAGGKRWTREPDADVEKLYILACGYNPRAGGEGPGGNEQHVLTYLLKKGAPIGPQGQTGHKIAAFVEVDPRNTDDVKRAIIDCGVAYIGFNVPQYIVPHRGAAAGRSGTSSNTNNAIVGGHAVVLAGYDRERRARYLLGPVLHDDLGLLRQICRRSLRHCRPDLDRRQGHDARAGSRSPSSKRRCRRSNRAETHARRRTRGLHGRRKTPSAIS